MSWNGRVERVQDISERFQTIAAIGKGAYGTVEKCLDLKTQEIVAVKQIMNMRHDGFPYNLIREIRLLHKLRHINIVMLKVVIQVEGDRDPGKMYLVFDYCEYDLYALLYYPDVPKVDPLVIKSLMKQLLVALHFCSIRQVIHRDLKPANMLVTKKGILKLADFGLAKVLQQNAKMSQKVITLWYRPPELLLGGRYGMAVDMWSAGCTLFEMATSKVLFQCHRQSEMAMIQTIFSILGLPNEKEWPGFRELSGSDFWRDLQKDRFPTESRLPEICDKLIPKEYDGLKDLLLRILCYDPLRRITPERALNHPFIKNMGKEVDPGRLPEITRNEMHQTEASEKKHRVEEPNKNE